MCPLRPGSSRATNMSRIHPSDRRAGHGDDARRATSDHQQPAVCTVWKRSSMGFQGTDGSSIYNAAGRLAFRVDNYTPAARKPSPASFCSWTAVVPLSCPSGLRYDHRFSARRSQHHL
uniref:Uncharacterized protein n=1 Tax=Avena sativa TaxID=4498 RepID=A0ACD5XYI0_AVESA